MTQDEIIEMAIQVELKSPDLFKLTVSHMSIKQLHSFAKLIAAKERESCVKVCDEFNFGQAPMMIQRAIRARGKA